MLHVGLEVAVVDRVQQQVRSRFDELEPGEVHVVRLAQHGLDARCAHGDELAQLGGVLLDRRLDAHRHVQGLLAQPAVAAVAERVAQAAEAPGRAQADHAAVLGVERLLHARQQQHATDDLDDQRLREVAADAAVHRLFRRAVAVQPEQRRRGLLVADLAPLLGEGADVEDEGRILLEGLALVRQRPRQAPVQEGHRRVRAQRLQDARPQGLVVRAVAALGGVEIARVPAQRLQRVGDAGLPGTVLVQDGAQRLAGRRLDVADGARDRAHHEHAELLEVQRLLAVGLDQALHDGLEARDAAGEGLQAGRQLGRSLPGAAPEGLHQLLGAHQGLRHQLVGLGHEARVGGEVAADELVAQRHVGRAHGRLEHRVVAEGEAEQRAAEAQRRVLGELAGVEDRRAHRGHHRGVAGVGRQQRDLTALVAQRPGQARALQAVPARARLRPLRRLVQRQHEGAGAEGGIGAVAPGPGAVLAGRVDQRLAHEGGVADQVHAGRAPLGPTGMVGAFLLGHGAVERKRAAGLAPDLRAQARPQTLVVQPVAQQQAALRRRRAPVEIPVERGLVGLHLMLPGRKVCPSAGARAARHGCARLR